MSTEPAARAVAELEIMALASRYCMAVDDGRFGDLEGLFAPDGRMHVMGTTHVGAADVRTFMEAAQPPEARGRHSTAGHLVAIEGDGTRARGWLDYVFFDAAGTVTNLGRYHDHYERDVEGRWRFSLREIVFRGAEPELTDDWT